MRPVSFQVEEEFEYYRELFEMILEDLEKYDAEKPIVMEGAAYLPELLRGCYVNAQRVIFMVPTNAFQWEYYQQREWVAHILKECEKPKEAFSNWMARDQRFGQEILRQAEDSNFETILVDGSQSIDEIFERVQVYFGLKSQ